MEAEAGVPHPFRFSISEYLIGFVFLGPILNWIARLRKQSLPLLIHSTVARQPTPRPAATAGAGAADTGTPPKGDVDVCMRAEELEVVMRSMGLMSGDQNVPAGDQGDLISTFEVQEPTLEEVHEAFMVFDRNGDGYVEAEELGVVLRMLGFRDPEASSPEKCERMIDAFDENGDGRIDFQEFVKLMERCFC